jgi:hypothetical protein
MLGLPNDLDTLDTLDAFGCKGAKGLKRINDLIGSGLILLTLQNPFECDEAPLLDDSVAWNPTVHPPIHKEGASPQGPRVLRLHGEASRQQGWLPGSAARASTEDALPGSAWRSFEIGTAQDQ